MIVYGQIIILIVIVKNCIDFHFENAPYRDLTRWGGLPDIPAQLLSFSRGYRLKAKVEYFRGL